MEMWLWRRMLRISWMEKRTDNSIIQELEIKRELLGHVRKRKLSYLGHLCRDHGCQITKTVVEGYLEGRRSGGRPRKQYIDNIKQWTQLKTSQCVRAAEDRKRWWPTIIRDLPKRRRICYSVIVDMFKSTIISDSGICLMQAFVDRS